ncbi:hypothetical protein EV586_110130 [Tumebacillus sp. BK434]|uniref:hypothetical protein n=1 Tax=Tumebacillus sp. BK434 TaxID=2512169 RepID=UPI00104B3751|nr:hypothetical protein [Tumebacillus sp. BK434]TCP52519.1 hypothetical protein EV586_110130 [Tumebacillus sp. BK434]
MKRLIAAGLCAGLILAGCAPQTAEPPKPAHEEKPTGESIQFDDLLQTTKIVMTTKAGSDLPKTWKFEGDEAKAKANSLVPVLKEGAALPAGEGRLVQSTVPMVSFILDVGTTKASINVYQDRYEFQGNWYQMENAPERTYGAINKLEK